MRNKSIQRILTTRTPDIGKIHLKETTFKSLPCTVLCSVIMDMRNIGYMKQFNQDPNCVVWPPTATAKGTPKTSLCRKILCYHLAVEHLKSL